MSLKGALLFGRYAFPPNRLGYCGPDDNQALLEQVSQGRPDRGLVELERRFEGAYPYLCLIAEANAIRDPFDSRVVEAYWIGNELLERVEAGPFHDSLSTRFRSRMKSSEFGWLERKLELAAQPHHNFHVFDVYVRAGLMRNERADIAVETMDSCRISWGRVAAVEGAALVVERPQLVLAGGKLALSEPRVVRAERQVDGHGFVDGVKAGDTVSIHWSWACDVLDAGALTRLRRATDRSLALANLTI
ncbi:MAG TPA: DUF6390 family protein [Patescibacteria group bacterium]|nr:DUF6390 family protein [Patescibacteria group bacterium]